MTDIRKTSQNLAACCPYVKKDPGYCPLTAVVKLERDPLRWGLTKAERRLLGIES